MIVYSWLVRIMDSGTMIFVQYIQNKLLSIPHKNVPTDYKTILIVIQKSSINYPDDERVLNSGLNYKKWITCHCETRY